jgi:hypothetical protein
MKDVAPALFTTWAMQGLNDLILRDRGLEAMPLPVGVLVLYGAATLGLGLWLFRVRHSAR